jgi:hypothetical protein
MGGWAGCFSEWEQQSLRTVTVLVKVFGKSSPCPSDAIPNQLWSEHPPSLCVEIIGNVILLRGEALVSS